MYGAQTEPQVSPFTREIHAHPHTTAYCVQSKSFLLATCASSFIRFPLSSFIFFSFQGATLVVQSERRKSWKGLLKGSVPHISSAQPQVLKHTGKWPKGFIKKEKKMCCRNVTALARTCVCVRNPQGCFQLTLTPPSQSPSNVQLTFYFIALMQSSAGPVELMWLRSLARAPKAADMKPKRREISRCLYFMDHRHHWDLVHHEQSAWKYHS